jgi:hypothetical protein
MLFSATATDFPDADVCGLFIRFFIVVDKPDNLTIPYPNVFENGSTHPGYILSISSRNPNINNMGNIVAKIPTLVEFGLLHTDFAKAAFIETCVDIMATT